MTAYYNENDPYAAQWLRNLVEAGHIAPGFVDERSIVDVRPDDLRGFKQCHFFAGIGVWSYALRSAGWRDDREVWTGSCPCQPFSAAGKGKGFADDRHLWPKWFDLIRECQPISLFGEQVASKDGLAWLDAVQTDLESEGYACGAVDTCAAGFGAPHLRQRIYFVAVADADSEQRDRRGESRAGRRDEPANVCGFSAVADATSKGLQGREQSGKRPKPQLTAAKRDSSPGDLADANGGNASAEREQRSRQYRQQPKNSGAVDGMGYACCESGKRDARGVPSEEARGPGARGENGRHDNRHPNASEVNDPGPTNGHWRAADWLYCRDDRWRPVEPGTFPLVNGSAARVGRVCADQARIAEIPPKKNQGSRTGRLRGYGNAINAAQAQGFIEAVMEAA